MRSVRLIRKLAASLNGFNLSHIAVGDVLELPDQTANMLIAERWAEPPTAKSNDQAKKSVSRPRASTGRRRK